MGKGLNASFIKPASHQRHSPLVGAGLGMWLLIRCTAGNTDEYPWLGIVQCLLLHGPCFQCAEFRLQQGGLPPAWLGSILPHWLSLIQPSGQGGACIEFQRVVTAHLLL